MDTKKILYGRKLLIVDDEPDVLQVLTEMLDMCKIDTASTFEDAKKLLETVDYDCTVLDIMGVKGFDLLAIARKRGIPALMLTAHALTEESLYMSVQDGASYFAPKDLMHEIEVFLADVLEAQEKKKNPWVRWSKRLGDFYDKRFVGTDWRKKEEDFWKKKLKDYSGL
ncbi:MAG: response regulator [Desulfomonilaceae bacterium]|nr:response regulator [Desulfomonilaceae bacterium]